MNITKYQHYEKIEFTGIQNFDFIRWDSGMWERTISHTICDFTVTTLLEIMYQKEVGKK